MSRETRLLNKLRALRRGERTSLFVNQLVDATRAFELQLVGSHPPRLDEIHRGEQARMNLGLEFPGERTLRG